jgi:hypothetical protein
MSLVIYNFPKSEEPFDEKKNLLRSMQFLKYGKKIEEADSEKYYIIQS